MNPVAQNVVHMPGRSVAHPLPAVFRNTACVAGLCLTDLTSVIAASGIALLEQRALKYWFPLKELTLYMWLGCDVFLVTVVACGFLLRGMYSSRREVLWETVRLTLSTTFYALLVAIAGLYLMNVAAGIPRSLALLSALNLFLIAPPLRIAAIRLLRLARLWDRYVVVVGKPQQAEAVKSDLERDFALGYRVIATRSIPEGAELGRTGEIDYPPHLDEVVIVTPDTAPEVVPALVAAAHRVVGTVTVIPELLDLPFAARRSRCLFDSRRILLTSRNLLREPVNVLLKRMFDLAASLLFTVLVFPLMIVLAILIRLDSMGPAVFAQTRMGRGGRRFSCLKFRTMYVDAEQRLAKLLEGDAALRKEWERFHKLHEDPRVTRLGRLLRRTSLDELPQFINVILGQMSLVGPRPLPEYHYEEIEEPYRSDYLDVTPGITGLWQVSGRSDADLQQMAVLNSWYARNWSLWLDVTLLLRTVPAVFSRSGAY